MHKLTRFVCYTSRRYSNNQYAELGKLTSLAYTHKALKRNENAVELFHKILAINPTNAHIHTALADTYENMGSIKSAIEHYRHAIQVSHEEDNFETSLLHFKTATLLKQVGQIEEMKISANIALNAFLEKKEFLKKQRQVLAEQGHTVEKEHEIMSKQYDYEDGTDETYEFVELPLKAITEQEDRIDEIVLKLKEML
jgi:tetratricopeptide (TPR) repeat protein